MVPPLDLSQLDKFRNGDEAVFKTLTDKFVEQLYGYSRRNIVNPAEAEDIVAETIEALWDYRKNIESENHIKNYCYRVASHKIIQYKKHHSRYTGNLPPILIDPQLAIIEDEVTAQVGYWAARADAIIQGIPHEYIKAFKLHLQGKSNEEIANEMNISPHTVKNHLARAKQRLSQRLLEEGFPRELHMLVLISLLN